jgi:hypothetical protein
MIILENKFLTSVNLLLSLACCENHCNVIKDISQSIDRIITTTINSTSVKALKYFSLLVRELIENFNLEFLYPPPLGFGFIMRFFYSFN